MTVFLHVIKEKCVDVLPSFSRLFGCKNFSFFLGMWHCNDFFKDLSIIYYFFAFSSASKMVIKKHVFPLMNYLWKGLFGLLEVLQIYFFNDECMQARLPWPSSYYVPKLNLRPTCLRNVSNGPKKLNDDHKINVNSKLIFWHVINCSHF